MSPLKMSPSWAFRVVTFFIAMHQSDFLINAFESENLRPASLHIDKPSFAETKTVCLFSSGYPILFYSNSVNK